MLVPAGAACALRVVGGGREFTLTPGKPVFVVASICSRFDKLTTGRTDQSEFRQAAVARANELGPESLARVRAAHVAWWRQFWAKSFVEIPDKVLEQRYYLSHYVMASASRVSDFPPGLFGWITTDKPSCSQHIYSAGGIGLDSPPELLERARNQIRVMNRWVDFNGMNSFYAAAARVGYDPNIILKEMRSMMLDWKRTI